MLLLTSTGDKLRLTTSSAASIDVQASYVDYSAGTITPGRTNSAPITTAITGDIVGSPAASTQRNVKHVSIRNKHASVSCDVTLIHTDGTNALELFKCTLAAGEHLVFNDGTGFTVFDAAGAIKTVGSSDVLLTRAAQPNVTSVGALSSLTVSGTIYATGGDHQFGAMFNMANNVGSTNAPTYAVDDYAHFFFGQVSNDGYKRYLDIVAGAGNTGSYLRLMTAQASSSAAVGITISPTQGVRLNAFGSGALTTDASGNITATSDPRLKDISGYFKRGLRVIRRLRPIVFHHNKKSGLNRKTRNVGFDASQVKPVISEAVGCNKAGYLTLSDRPILAALVNAVKELDEIVRQQKIQIQQLLKRGH